MAARTWAWALLLLPAGAAAAEEPPPKAPEGPAAVEVSPDGSTGFATIASALRAVAPGGKVVLAPGTYAEGVVAEQEVTLEGKGKAKDVVVTGSGGTGVVVRGGSLVLRSVTVAVPAVEGATPGAVRVDAGRLTAEDCVFSSVSGIGVSVAGREAVALLRGCRIGPSGRRGIVVDHGGSLTAERTEVLDSGETGLMAGTDAVAVVREGTLRGAQRAAVCAYGKAKVTLEKCDLYGNGNGAVECRDGAEVLLRGGRVRSNRKAGVWIYGGGRARLEDCEVSDNERGGVVCQDASEVAVARSRLHDNGESGVCVFDGAKAVVEDCLLAKNGYSGVEARSDARIEVRKCRLLKNVQYGFNARKGVQGNVERCEVKGNGRGPWWLDPGSLIVRLGNDEK